MIIQDPDKSDGYLATASIKPSILLAGETPRLIDEWQMAPVLWDAVRTAVDSRKEKGQFILTGSTSVDEKKIMHTGTGRTSRMKMYSMSLYESLESNGKISLMDLFNCPDMNIDGICSDLTIERLVFAACRGGWPGSLTGETEKYQLMTAKDYFNDICESDISTVDGTSRNPEWTKSILRSYARNISTLAKRTMILKDVENFRVSISLGTIDSYVNALERLFVIQDVNAWNPAIRSATVIRSGRKIEFTDPSIAAAAMGISYDSLMLDFKTFGFLFECLCIRDLRIYSQSHGGNISYYHDRLGLEADAVLHLDDGRYA